MLNSNSIGTERAAILNSVAYATGSREQRAIFEESCRPGSRRFRRLAHVVFEAGRRLADRDGIEFALATVLDTVDEPGRFRDPVGAIMRHFDAGYAEAPDWTMPLEYEAGRIATERLASDHPPGTPGELASELCARVPFLKEDEAALAAVRAFHTAGRPVAEGALVEASRAVTERFWAEEHLARRAVVLRRRENARFMRQLRREGTAQAVAVVDTPARDISPAEPESAVWFANPVFDSENLPPEEDLADDVAAEVAGGSALAELTHPPGLVGALIDWIVSSAERPSRELALGPALCFVAALAGRRFASPSDARTNLYMLSLAPSGYGKDHALKALKRLVVEGQFERFLGPARVMSASALRKVLKVKPSPMLLIDEAGGFFRQITDRKAGLHNAMIKTDLLELFSAAGTAFMGAEYAGETAEVLYSPNLIIHGTSTPEDFWSGVTSLNGDDGLLARFILINVGGERPAEVEPVNPPRYVDRELITFARRILQAGAAGNIAEAVGGAANPTPRIVPYGDGAKEMLAAFKLKIEDQRQRADNAGRATLHRVAEHAIKLALTVAVGENPEDPTISAAHMEWACRLAWHSACAMLTEMRDRIADNQREAAFNRILRLIKGAGPEGISPGRITDATRSLDGRMRTEILKDIVATGRAEYRQAYSVTGRGRRRERYVATGRAVSS